MVSSTRSDVCAAYFKSLAKEFRMLISEVLSLSEHILSQHILSERIKTYIALASAHLCRGPTGGRGMHAGWCHSLWVGCRLGCLVPQCHRVPTPWQAWQPFSQHAANNSIHDTLLEVVRGYNLPGVEKHNVTARLVRLTKTSRMSPILVLVKLPHPLVALQPLTLQQPAANAQSKSLLADSYERHIVLFIL